MLSFCSTSQLACSLIIPVCRVPVLLFPACVVGVVCLVVFLFCFFFCFVFCCGLFIKAWFTCAWWEMENRRKETSEIIGFRHQKKYGRLYSLVYLSPLIFTKTTKRKQNKPTKSIQNGIQWRKHTKWKPNDRNVSSSSPPPQPSRSGVAVEMGCCEASTASLCFHHVVMISTWQQDESQNGSWAPPEG